MTAASAAATLSSLNCFGSTCIVLVDGRGRTGTAADAVALARRRLLDWHLRLSRFDPLSELSRVNADPRRELPVGRVMARLAAAVAVAGRMTGGLVDGTLVEEIETAGYRGDLGRSLPLPLALRLAPPRRAAAPSPARRWREIRVDVAAGTLRRPLGVRIDGGGLAKGLFADLLAAQPDAASCRRPPSLRPRSKRRSARRRRC